MAKHAFPSGVATGKTSASGSMGYLSSFEDSGPTQKFTKPKGPNFSHSSPGKGPKHGGGTVGEKGEFNPYKGS